MTQDRRSLEDKIRRPRELSRITTKREVIIVLSVWKDWIEFYHRPKGERGTVVEQDLQTWHDRWSSRLRREAC
jgi:hypothetical protein